MTIQLTPAAEKLLREAARRDKGDGVTVRYSGRGRWHLDGTTTGFNTRTFWPLYEAELVTGWDEHDDDGPLRLTDAGRKVATELEAKAAEQQAAKKARPKQSADGAAATRLLREIAQAGESTVIYNDGRRRAWQVGARDGYSASINTWMALVKAGRIHIATSFAGGQRATVTAAGRAHLAA
jgi:hypothetical protein